jgi:hypothetical protein
MLKNAAGGSASNVDWLKVNAKAGNKVRDAPDTKKRAM